MEHIPILRRSSSGIENINSSSGLPALDLEETENILDIPTTSDKNCENNVNILSEILNSENCSESVKQITGYISGWIARKLTKMIKCEICVDSLHTTKKSGSTSWSQSETREVYAMHQKTCFQYVY